MKTNSNSIYADLQTPDHELRIKRTGSKLFETKPSFLTPKLLIVAIASLFCGIITTKAQEKRESTIELTYYKKADMTKSAVALVTAKNNQGKFTPAKNARVSFYMQNKNEQQFLKNVYTDNKGKALIELQKEMPLDTGSAFIIVAKIENDSSYENAEEKIRFKEANINIKLYPHDTSRTATAVITEIGKDGKQIPVKDVKVNFYVQRLFGVMPATEEYTINSDENGEAVFSYPKSIPGDTAGLITIAVRMEDNEKYGNVENKANASWGTRLMVDKDPFPRALWEPYAPLPLVITISLLFGGVWITYFFVFYQMRKISKEKQLGPVNE
jgi:5-hydroxyisourate hydrolase-like protein (transthyretin family)